MKFYQELISITKNGSENLCIQNAYHDIKENLMIITKTCFLLELNILYISHIVCAVDIYGKFPLIIETKLQSEYC